MPQIEGTCVPFLDRCHALVLAAGHGKRAGGPKALVRDGNTVWWRFQERALRAVGVERVWVVSEVVRQEIERHDDAPAHMVTADPDNPMFASILAGLRSIPLNTTDGCFVLPIDTPVPDRIVWEGLAAFDTPRVPECVGKHGHPVFLPLPWVRTLLTDIDSGKLDPAGQRLDTLIASSAVYFPVDDPTISLNLNTQADFHDYLKSLPG